jgi:hypothetical protein
MRRRTLALGALALIGIAAAAPAVRNAIVPGNSEAPIAADTMEPAPVVRQTPSAPKAADRATPMAERVAVLGLLNKRNGLSRDLRLKPGQGVNIGNVIVKLRACEQTEPWERDQLTGAFVQVIVRDSDATWRRVFSGWLYKETPSLNLVEHPIYDVWTKACTMRHPEGGPDTVTLDAPSSSTRSKARQSPAAPPEAASETESETAASSNSI